jgi:hypothetical protein
LDLKECPRIMTLRYPGDNAQLTKIFLHPQNGFHPGISKIEFTRDEKNKLLREDYFNQFNQPAENPFTGYAMIIHHSENKSEIGGYSLKKKKRFDSGNTSPLILYIIIPGLYIISIISLLIALSSEKCKGFHNIVNSFQLMEIKPSIVFKWIFKVLLILPKLLALTRPCDYYILSSFKEELLPEVPTNRFGGGEYYDGSLVKPIRDDGLAIQEVPEVPLISAIQQVEGIIFLEGDSGLGKTMFALKLLSKLEERTKKLRQLPVYLEARHCRIEGGVIGAIRKLLCHSIFREERSIEQLIKNKTLTLFIDGLNEVDKDTQKTINTFLLNFSQCNILVTTQHIEFSLPKGAKKYLLLPLDIPRLESFLEVCEQRFADAPDVLENYKRISRAWLDSIKEKIQDETIDEEEMEILSNPMNLSILADVISRTTNPKDIDISRLFDRLFQHMNEYCKRNNKNRDFRLIDFSKALMKWWCTREKPPFLRNTCYGKI